MKKKEELIERIDQLEKRIDKLLEQNVIESVEITQTKYGEEIDFTKLKPNRIVEIVEISTPKSLIRRENSRIDELITSDDLKTELNQAMFPEEKPQPQEHKLIVRCADIDRFDFKNWLDVNNKKLMFNLFSELKFIEQQWNEGKEFDWENEDDKYCLFLHENKWRYLCFGISHQIFNFHTKEHAELFLKTFAKELEIIKPLFS